MSEHTLHVHGRDIWMFLTQRIARCDHPLDDRSVLSFLRGDLVAGYGRYVDVIDLAQAWDRVMAYAPSLSAQSLDQLLLLAAEVPSGDPMRGLVQVLRAAISSAVLDERRQAMAQANNPLAQQAAAQLEYGLSA